VVLVEVALLEHFLTSSMVVGMHLYEGSHKELLGHLFYRDLHEDEGLGRSNPGHGNKDLYRNVDQGACDHVEEAEALEEEACSMGHGYSNPLDSRGLCDMVHGKGLADTGVGEPQVLRRIQGLEAENRLVLKVWLE